MSEAAPETGEKIGLQHIGATPVTLPDGTETQRYAWKVHGAGELAYDQLERRLSRSGVKETTLDYTNDFAERRGIADIELEDFVPFFFQADGFAMHRAADVVTHMIEFRGFGKAFHFTCFLG